MKPDPVTLKDTSTSRPPHPNGNFLGRCVDVIALGNRLQQYQDNPPYIAEQVVLVFGANELGEDGKPVFLAQEYTLSGGKKAKLRKHLEGWRGKPYTDEEIKRDGIPLDKLCGQACSMNVIHKTSAKGNVYAMIDSLARPPKGVEVPVVAGYERGEWWEKRKEEYRAEVDRYLAGAAAKKAAHDAGFEDYEDAPEVDGDGLPF